MLETLFDVCLKKYHLMNYKKILKYSTGPNRSMKYVLGFLKDYATM